MPGDNDALNDKDGNMAEMANAAADIENEISSCQICSSRFLATATSHKPRPVTWFQKNAKILISGQAPGMRVHNTGIPFNDPSGKRLREWLGMSSEEFHDRKRVAMVPMAFCFPGYDEKGADLPPPKICAQTWHARVMKELCNIRLSIYVGGYSHKYHLNANSSVTATVKSWRTYAPERFPIPHSSWRNTGWIAKNKWFEDELLPVLQSRVREVLDA